MRTKLRWTLPFVGLSLAVTLQAQRYLSEVFTSAQVTVTPDIVFGQNIDFLTSNFSNPGVFGPELGELQLAVTNSQPIPAAYFDPSDGSTAVKVANIRMDIYQPDQGVDTETARPVFIFVHTGNLLPPPINGSPTGTRKDSSAVEVCKRMARRGYVAVSMSYRGGWNPLGSTVEIRRGTLLNAVYRAIHDLKQCVRTLKADAADANTYAIDPSKMIAYGEGTGGYIVLASATLDEPEELFIEKFRPDPFDETVSYVDTNQVGNIEGFGGALALYRPNGFDSDFQFCVNAGGALADTSWLAPGDVPMVAFHTTFDPFAPFTEGVVIVPTTGEQVLPLQGSNLFIQLANTYGNNVSFATLPNGDPYTDRARALYGSNQVHGATTVHINTGNEGLYPFVTPNWPAQIPGTFEEASPWQWWDPNSSIAQTVVVPGPPAVTAGQASQASNPNFSPEKGRTYIDTIMAYMNPRIVCALILGICPSVIIDCEGTAGGPALPGTACDDGDGNTTNDTWSSDCVCVGEVGINEPVAAQGLRMVPNPMTDVLRVTSERADMLSYTLLDATGRKVRAHNVNARNFVIDRNDLQAGSYFLVIDFADGRATRKLTIQ